MPPEPRLASIRNEIGLLLSSIREAGDSNLAAFFTYHPRSQSLLLAHTDPEAHNLSLVHPVTIECAVTRALHGSLSLNYVSSAGSVCEACQRVFGLPDAIAIPIGMGVYPTGVVALFGQAVSLTRSELGPSRRLARVMSALVSQVDARLHERERAAGLVRLHKAATSMHSNLDAGRLCPLVLEEAIRLAGAEWGALYLRSEQDGSLSIRTTRGIAPRLKRHLEETALVRSPGAALRSGKLVTGRNSYLVGASSFRVPQGSGLGNVEETICIPLVSRGESLGVLELGRGAVRPFKPLETELLESFAGHAGTAVANALAYEQARTHLDAKRRELANMSRIGQAIQTIGTSLEINTLLSNIVRGAAEPFKNAGGSIALLDRERGDLYFAASSDLHVTPVGARLSMDTSASGWVVRNCRPLFVPSLAEAPSEVVRTRLRQERMKSFVGVPLVVRNTAIGSLNVYSRVSEEFEWSDVEMLQAMASQAAIAIEHASLYASVASQKARLEALVGSLHEGLLFVNDEGHVTFVNRRLKEFLGTKARDHPATPASAVWDRLVEQSSAPAETRREIESLLTDPSTTIVVSLARPSRRDLEIRCFMVEPNDSSAPGWGYLFRDVTHQSEVERLKTSILSTVSHELRTPLAGIKGFATSLLRTDVQWDQASTRDFLTQIDHETDRLTALVRNLLDMSRLDTGSIRLDLEWCDLCELTREVLSQAEFLVGDRRLEYCTDVGTMPILMDRRYIERVIWNLIDNAAKYSPPRTAITASVIRNHGEIGLSVRDQGIGVRPEERELIFERFYRGTEGRRKATGTGLGLAICKGIVVAHRGSISVESGEGDGSTFTVWFPEPTAVWRGENAEHA